MAKRWDLKDKEFNHKVKGLSTDEVKLVASAIAPERRRHWMAKDSDSEIWKPIWQVREFLIPPPLPEHSPEATKPQIDDTTLEVDVNQVQDRRSNRRFQKSFDLTVFGKSKQKFTTVTVDISLEGLCIRDPLPDWVRDPFSAVLERNDERISLLLNRVAKKDHVNLKIISVDPLELLRQWLLKW